MFDLITSPANNDAECGVRNYPASAINPDDVFAGPRWVRELTLNETARRTFGVAIAFPFRCTQLLRHSSSASESRVETRLRDDR